MTVQTAIRDAPPLAPPLAPDRPRLRDFLSDLAAAWWWGVRLQVAAMHGFPANAVEPGPPAVRWPFAHL
jgi:hypothetical protein